MGNPCAAIRERVIERAIGIPAHHWTVESHTEVIDRAWIEQCALEDQNEVSGLLLRIRVDPPTELTAKRGSEYRLAIGCRDKPSRTPRTEVEQTDGVSGTSKCRDQGVA